MTLARLVGVLALVSLPLAWGTGCASNETPGVLARTTEVLDPATIERILAGGRERGQFDAPRPDSPPTNSHTLLLKSREFTAHFLRIEAPLPRRLHQGHDLTLFVYRGAGDVIIENLRRRARPGDLFHVPRSTPYLVTPRDGPLILVAFFTPPLEQDDAIDVPADEPSYERGN